MKPPPTCKDCPSRDHDTCYYYPKSPMPIVKDEPFRFYCPLIFKKPKHKRRVKIDLPIEETMHCKEWMYAQYVINELSTKEIGKLVNRTGSNVIRWLHKHEIRIRNTAENMALARKRKMKNLDMKARCK